MDKKAKAGAMMRAYGASEAQVNKWLEGFKAAVENEDAKALCIDSAPDWHPLPMDICISSGLVEDRLAFTARTSSHGYMRFTVRLSQLDNGADARVIQCEHPIAVSRTLATLPDCGWLLPQLLAAREQYQADLWAIIKGDKQ